jgi:2-desacetyl-2-hydroxyethyl bacteriochlorophyllide A dehydrogenase
MRTSTQSPSPNPTELKEQQQAGDSLSQTTMKAAVATKYGGPFVLRYQDIPAPAPDRDKVLIQVNAAGINPIDCRIRRGQMKWILPARFPLVLGYDVAGEVLQVPENAGSEGIRVGDKVMSYLDNRLGAGYAQLVTASPSAVVRVPDNISMHEAASIPLAASTALQSLRDLGRIKDGDDVLINGASGGVGHFAIQLAKGFGATVTAVCSHSNINFVKQLGADRAINYETNDFTDESAKYDIIFDAVAKSNYRKCRRVLKSEGTYITTVPSFQTGLFNFLTWFGRKCRFVLARSRKEDLLFLKNAVQTGILQPHIQDVFSLDMAAQAHEVSEGHHVRGKLVLDVNNA